MMRKPTTKRLAGGLTAVLAAALVAVPVAQARLDPGQPGRVVRTDARHATLAQRAGARVVIVKESPESKIAQMHRHLTQLNLPAEKTAGPVSSSSFDWGDAGIGATAGLVLVLAAGAGVLVTRRRLVSV
jgi:hypothetical protein